MNKLIIVVSLLVMMLVSSSIAQDATDSQLWEAFNNWAQNYGVLYDSTEIQAKFQAWKANALFIANHNAGLTAPDILIQNSGVSAAQESALGELSVMAGEEVVTFPMEESASQLNFNQFSDLTFEEFEMTYTGGAPDANAIIPAAAAGAALSTGAIVGIAVGGAAAAAGVTAGAIVAVKKRKGKKTTHTGTAMEEVDTTKKISNQPKVDVFKFENPHHSITARAVPVNPN